MKPPHISSKEEAYKLLTPKQQNEHHAKIRADLISQGKIRPTQKKKK